MSLAIPKLELSFPIPGEGQREASFLGVCKGSSSCLWSAYKPEFSCRPVAFCPRPGRLRSSLGLLFPESPQCGV